MAARTPSSRATSASSSVLPGRQTVGAAGRVPSDLNGEVDDAEAMEIGNTARELSCPRPEIIHSHAVVRDVILESTPAKLTDAKVDA